MAAKVGLLSENQRSSEIPAQRVRRAVADYLVRRLLAVQVAKYLYQRVKIRPAEQVIASPSNYSEPARSSHAPRLKWEPPKHQRPLKAHPWASLYA